MNSIISRHLLASPNSNFHYFWGGSLLANNNNRTTFSDTPDTNLLRVSVVLDSKQCDLPGQKDTDLEQLVRNRSLT